MISALLLIALSQAPDNVKQGPAGNPHELVRPRLFRNEGAPRISRLGADDYAFFEAFPTSGAGTFGPCSTTAPTGAKGEVLTLTRASNATCTKTASGGLATTGIADGDLVVLSSNVARVEYDSAGTLGLLVESQGINLLPRFDALTNALWSDVGTPTVTDGATSPFGTTTGDTIDDNDAVAYEGRSQAVTVSAGAAHVAYCYVKAGTLAKARITLDGTAASTTALSATTWSILQVADASSSGVAITLEILAGSAVGDTGTIIVGGCDVKVGTYITSIVPTAGATATRVVETAKMAIPAFDVSRGSASVYAETTGHTADTGWWAIEGGTSFRLAGFGAGVSRFEATALKAAAGTSQTGRHKRSGGGDGTASFACEDTTCATGAAVTSTGTGTFFWLGDYNVGAPGTRTMNGIISRVCLDPDPSRCR